MIRLQETQHLKDQTGINKKPEIRLDPFICDVGGNLLFFSVAKLNVQFYWVLTDKSLSQNFEVEVDAHKWIKKYLLNQVNRKP